MSHVCKKIEARNERQHYLHMNLEDEAQTRSEVDSPELGFSMSWVIAYGETRWCQASFSVHAGIRKYLSLA